MMVHMGQMTPVGDERYEPMRFRLGFGTDMTVYVPKGSLPSAQRILDLIAPAAPDTEGQQVRRRADGQEWTVPELASLAAIAVLPAGTRDGLLFDYQFSSPAAQSHIAAELHAHCASESADLEESKGMALRGLPALGVGAGATAAQVGNALVFRGILDAAFGRHSLPRMRVRFLGAALYRYENGTDPDRGLAKALDGRMRTLATLPEIDYLATAGHTLDRALAYVLVLAVATRAGLTVTWLAPRAQPLDATAAFAVRHLANPQRYADSVRSLGTLDPEQLSLMIGRRA